MKLGFTIILIVFGALAAIGQAMTHINLDATPAEFDTLKAPNVSVGTYTITAAYPTVEFRLYPADMKIMVSVTDNLGTTTDQVEEALVSQVTSWVWRAQLCENTFVEINTATGTTFVHQHCLTRVFMHDAAAWKTEVTKK